MARAHLDGAIHAAFAAGRNSALRVAAAIGIAGATLVALTVPGRAEAAVEHDAVPAGEAA